ncbi:hypothetical protein HanRHA438_Chr10g0445681 [Helianthus annuus]|nr:hypothetical protein HanIR_Chr10g0467271 [Helianthus annuus]KAJ0878940.1 hypothetical protein HanRHA438_Chr10g0445681 [Helianthus annuus]
MVRERRSEREREAIRNVREAVKIGENIRRSNGCSIQHQIQIWFRSEIQKDDPVPRCYQIQKMLQIRLKMFRC